MVKTHLFSRFHQWINRRVPRSNTHHLNHNNLFIVPTRFGFGMLFCCSLLFILGTNYQNNPILILCYLLLSWFLLSMYVCFFNLNLCSISIDKIEPSYVHDQYEVELTVKTKSEKTEWQFFVGKTQIHAEPRVSSEQPLHIRLTAFKRGLRHLPRLKVSTQFPFGLFECWSYLRFEQQHWVYPNTEQGDWRTSDRQMELPDEQITADHGHTPPNSKLHEQNFEGIKPFHPGEPMSRVSWKHQAKQPDAALVLKDFSDNVQSDYWLRFDLVSGENLEQKLSVLTHAVLTLESENRPYGLMLSGYQAQNQVLIPDNGATHLTQCLQALACYGQVNTEHD